MSRTDLDAVTLASSLRMKAGDGSVEWVYEPIQASVLLDIADMLDDNANLRERITTQKQTIQSYRDESREWREAAEHAQAENAKLRELVEHLQPIDCEGNVLDIADTVGMLRSEYDGDHEWDDVVVELALTKWGGDRWIVRGSKGEAWACDCLKTGYDEDAYEGSDDAEPIVNPSLIEVENAKLRELLQDYHLYEHEDCHSCRYINECRADESGRCIAPMRLGERYREIGVEVDE